MKFDLDADRSWESEPADVSDEALALLARYKTNMGRLLERWEEITAEHSAGWVALSDDGVVWMDENHSHLIQRLLEAGALRTAAIIPLKPVRNFVASA